MTYAVWFALFLDAAGSAPVAQESGKAVAVQAPPQSASYVWITLRGANAVDIRQTGGALVTTLPAGTFGFSQPWDIVSLSALRRVLVSNRGATPGTVTVINMDTLQFVQTVTLAGSTNLRGMSVSEDESAVFVAGADAAGSSIYRIDTATMTGARIFGQADGRGAEDCVTIRASNSGGSGSGPGKVFFSIRQPLAAGTIGIITLGPPQTVQLIATGGAVLPEVQLADTMERTPDSRFVFVGCSKNTSFGADARVIRIDPATNAMVARIVGLSSQDLATNRVFDVTWRTDSGGANRGYVLAFFPPSANRHIFEIDEDVVSLGGPFQADVGGVTPSTLRFAPLTDQLFVGEVFGTSNQYNFFSAPAAGGVGAGTTQLANGGDPMNFAVLSAPTPVISDICPRAGPAQAGVIVTVHGSGFMPQSTVGVGAAAVPIAGFIDSNTILVNMGGLTPTLLSLQINNPNFQSGTIAQFYRRYAVPEFRYLPTDPEARLPLPSAAQGYRMVSFPQYATLTALKAAFTAALGPYNPVLYRVFFYRNGGYVELNQLSDDGCDLAGESFWVLTRNGGILTLTEPDVFRNAGGPTPPPSPRVIPINPGFNMISQPVLLGGGSINWNNVLVTLDETNFAGAIPVTTIPGQAIVGTAAVELVNGSYVTADPLVTGRGYWVRNLQNVPAYLVFDPGFVFKPGSASGSNAGGLPPPAGMNPPPPPSGMVGGSSGGSGGCGLLGAEGLLLALARAVFPGKRAHRKLTA